MPETLPGANPSCGFILRARKAGERDHLKVLKRKLDRDAVVVRQ